MKKVLKSLKKMNLAWYVKLNVLVLSFLFILFLIKQTNTTQFKQGLQAVFPGNHTLEESRPAVEILNP